MKTPEDEAFDDLAKKQGSWGGGFPAKRQMAADKLHWSDCAVHNGPAYPAGPCDCGVAQEPKRKALNLALDGITKVPTLTHGLLVKLADVEAVIDKALAQPEPEMLTIAYQSGYYDGKQAALAKRE